MGHGDQVQRVFHLEKTLLEEQLYSSDLKKKLQTANKQIATLKTKVKALKQQCYSASEGGRGGERSSLSPTGVAAEESILERSLSMNDLDQEEEDEGDGKEEVQKGGSPPSQFRLPRLNITKQR